MVDSNPTRIRVLLVEDDEYDQFAFLRAVKRQTLPYEVTVCDTVAATRETLAKQIFDIAIVDHKIGVDTAFVLFNDFKDMPFVIVTGAGDEELAVQAMKMGASDYLVKDMGGNYLKTLDITIRNALQRQMAKIKLKEYQENLEILVAERTQELSLINQQLRSEITERKQAEEMIRLQATAMKVAANGIIIMDLEGKVIWVNPALCEIMGYSEAEILGKSAPSLLLNPDNTELLPTITKAIESKKEWSGEIKNTRRDGSVFTIEMSTTPVLNEVGETTHFTAILHDVTERMRSQKLLEYMATHDSLTNLPNRLLFHDRVHHAMANARRNNNKVAILFLDLDDFKAINDAFGHAKGDELLVYISNRMASYLRETDTIARLGGDEFSILVENINKPEDAANVARKIIQAISQPTKIQGNLYSISGSIGISIYPDDGNQAEQLIQNADTAMYQAKERGKSTYQFYTQEMTDKVMSRLRTISQLKNAILDDSFELYYQPQIDIQNQKVIGLEALLRFCVPGGGFISPEVFIPIAEKAGMIIEIGDWVLNQACQQSKRFSQEGFNLRLSVNISGKQLNHPAIVPTVEKAIKISGIRPHSLMLEITENSMFENIDYALQVISKLKALGVKIAIDDFGTGYSSLGYLTQLALDTIKIDKSFAHNITLDSNRKAVVRGIVAIAKAINVPTIIEGVETKAQLDFFHEMDCKILQGFYFSSPVPASEIPSLLNKNFT